jgi:trans-aconitate methyltransferase
VDLVLPEPQPMTDYYDAEIARLFMVFGDDHAVISRPWLRQVLPPASGSKNAVDLGCGSGRWTELLTSRYAEVLGVDVSPQQVALAQQANPAAAFSVTDLMDVGGQYDVVLSVNTLHYVKDPAVLEHVRRLVAPGGTAVLMDVTQDAAAEHPWDSLEGQIDDAFQDARESYEQRSKDYAVAADVLKLHLHPVWLRHCLSDVPLTRSEFVDRYGAAFPGARFTDLHRVQTGMAWTRPD